MRKDLRQRDEERAACEKAEASIKSADTAAKMAEMEAASTAAVEGAAAELARKQAEVRVSAACASGEPQQRRLASSLTRSRLPHSTGLAGPRERIPLEPSPPDLPSCMRPRFCSFLCGKASARTAAREAEARLETKANRSRVYVKPRMFPLPFILF